MLRYLQDNADFVYSCKNEDKQVKSLKDIWEDSVYDWIWIELYDFALKNPRDDPERVLHEWYLKMHKNYVLAKGSDKMEGLYFEAIRILDYIREELWEGYRE